MSQYQLGLNFSHREAVRLGLDADEAFYALLIHLKPPILRLSLYWNEISPSAGEYDFSRIRALLDRAEKHGSRVLLTVGFKPQRHPAFFPPPWLRSSRTHADASVQEQGRLAAALLMMLERAIALLADYDAIDSWEVEFMPFLRAREQPSGWTIGRSLLAREIGVLHDVDPRHRPVVVSHPGGRLLDRGWRHALVAADVLGCVLAGPEPAHRSLAQLRRRLAVDVRTWQLSIQATLAARFARPLWVTELTAEQASETNGHGPRQGLGLEEVLDAAFSAGAERIYLSGVEEWLLQRSRGRPEQWDEARNLLRLVAERLP